MIAYFLLGGRSLTTFYVLAGVGAWASATGPCSCSTGPELFGTNLRATVATTVPNFVRGSLVLLTSGFQLLEGAARHGGAAIAVGVFSYGVAFAGCTRCARRSASTSTSTSTTPRQAGRGGRHFGRVMFGIRPRVISPSPFGMNAIMAVEPRPV